MTVTANRFAHTVEEADQYRSLRRQVLAHVQEVRVLPDGLALHFVAQERWVSLLAQYVRLERLRCPFVHFTLDVPVSGPLALHLRGDAEVMAFLNADLHR